EHQMIWSLYAELFRLRRETPSLRSLDLDAVETEADDERSLLLIRRSDALIAFNFSAKTQRVALLWSGAWKALLDTGASVDGGHITMPPTSFAIYSR
ncbi:MAG TPA: DUF3459 domain-containing protein, partial [Thermoanaerobaculia bacterium]|nr:DUF3459 domain-containing protein [Thermoanaerobaculia bacterium]